MHGTSRAMKGALMAIALYFAGRWGIDAIRVFASPNFGLDEVWRSQDVFTVGRLFGLTPPGLYELAAFLGAVKLVTAAAFALSIANRFAGPAGADTNAEIVEAALVLVVTVSIVATGPAAWAHNAGLLREHTLHLVLAALATALCIAEQRQTPPADTPPAPRALALFSRRRPA